MPTLNVVPESSLANESDQLNHIETTRQTDANLALVKSTYEGHSSAENAKNLEYALANDAR